jgi:putative membrane protein
MLQGIGFMSKWPNAVTIESETWVKIEGTIDSTLNNNPETGGGVDLPVIMVDKVEKIQKPENIYVYS